MERKEMENEFTTKLEQYLATSDPDAKEDFMYAANILVANKWYKPMSVRAMYEKITGKTL